MSDFDRKDANDLQFITTDAWRVFRIISEFVDGFENMTNIGPSVSIFGSARLNQESPYYQLGIDVAALIAKKGFAIITGGGPGIMEAANKGAQLAHGSSCGLVIDLPFESEPNGFIDPKYRLKFRYFFVRKVMFAKYSQGFVMMPGGWGTMDEFFEVATLIQTQKFTNTPMICMGSQYWKGLFDWMRETMLEKENNISPGDLEMIKIFDTADEVVNYLHEFYSHNKLQPNF